MSNMQNVFISILNFNGEKNTYECLKSLSKLDFEGINLSTIVLDNGSSQPLNIKDQDFKRIRLHVIKSQVNLGFSGGHNLILKYALERGAQFILVLNNDTLAARGLLKNLLQILKNEDIGIASPKIYFSKGFEFHKERYKENELGKILWYAGGIMDWRNLIGKHRGVDEVDWGQYEKAEETELATGACMLVKSEVIKKIGFFNEKYFLYYEDADFAMRTKRAGYKIFYQPKSILWHGNAESSGGSGSTLQDYYITRNRMLFGMSYAPLRTKISLIKESLFLLVKGRKWQRKGILDFYIGKLGRGSFRT